MEITIKIIVDENEVKDVKVETENEVKNQDVKLDEQIFSQYARFFDDVCVGWTKEAEYNKAYLMNTQKYMNDKLRANGYLFLNDVYDTLGIPRTKAGQIVGWIYNEEHPIGDNFVDFGLTSERNRNFINGFENVALLDFNVDGNILDLI